MAKIKIRSLNKEILVKEDQNLMDVLVDNDIFIDNPCNGKGTCGKCKVKILSGEVNMPNKSEKDMLSKKELDNSIRLSCLINPVNDLEIETVNKEKKHRILTTGCIPEFKYNPTFNKKEAFIKSTDLKEQIDYETRLKDAFDIDNISWDVLNKDLKNKEKIFGIFYKEKLVSISDKKDSSLYGIAIDIGTTTLVASLVNLENGKEIEFASMINPQKKYGLDVLTRITYAMENQDSAKDNLQKSIVKGINDLIDQLIKKVNIRKENLYEIVVSGNTTMLHMLLGVDSRNIGKAPYAPIFTKSKTLKAKEIGLNVNNKTMLYCMPSVSSYIGADIVSGSYTCGLHKKNNTTLFIDIGTNGEIVLSHNNKLLSCSCAAGPALEGMNISSGMRAQDGAIEEIDISKDGIKTKVIGDIEGTGLCGSGILAVLREMIKNKIVKKNGAIIKLDKLDDKDYRKKYLRLKGKKRELVINSKPDSVIVTQSDVRQVQLAKGAILSGFHALLNKVDIDIKDLDEVIVAGQFGAHLSVDSLIGTGILPEEVRNKLTYVGNASKTGAYMALMSLDVRKQIEKLANQIEYMELSTTKNYERLFAKSLLFK
ncbi:MAG: ASKHA domain-containing protein [Bacillota bacterium]